MGSAGGTVFKIHMKREDDPTAALCGTSPGFYDPLKITASRADVTCERCQAKVREPGFTAADDRPVVVLTIPGRPAVLKNSKRVIARGPGRRAIVLPSLRYQNWEQHAAIWLKNGFTGHLIDYPIEARFRFFFKDRHAEPDVSNLIEGPQDVMAKVGIIKNDRLIRRVIAEKLFGHEPRTEIELYRWRT